MGDAASNRSLVAGDIEHGQSVIREEIAALSSVADLLLAPRSRATHQPKRMGQNTPCGYMLRRSTYDGMELLAEKYPSVSKILIFLSLARLQSELPLRFPE